MTTIDDRITEWTPLVVAIAKRYAAETRTWRLLDDYIHDARLALWDALRTYEVSSGMSLKNFIWKRVKWAMQEILRNDSQSRHKYYVMPFCDLNESLKRWIDNRCDDPCAVSNLEAEDRARMIQGYVYDGVLNDTERRVIVLIYWHGMFMRDIGDLIGVTESRISQIHKAAIGKLRRAIGGSNCGNHTH